MGPKVSHSLVGETLKKDLEYTRQNNKKQQKACLILIEKLNLKRSIIKMPTISVDSKKREGRKF